MSPLVSVIIPGYNHAPYLHERIDTVLAQDYPNFEVILLDDCSPDNSAEIMLSYKDHERVSHVIINEKNTHNTFVQWERGINLAKGDYIWIAESDDAASHDLLSKLMAKLTDNPNAVLAFCHSTMIDSEGKALDYTWDQKWLYKSPGIYDGKSFCKKRMVLKNLLYNASMIVWRKDNFHNISDRYKNYRHCGDWLFWFDMAMQGDVAEVPEELSRFRQHANKVSNNATASGADFEEMGDIQSYILRSLGASSFQYRVVRGRMTKRIKKLATREQQERLRRSCPEIFRGTLLDSICYTIDKVADISGFQNSK